MTRDEQLIRAALEMAATVAAAQMAPISGTPYAAGGRVFSEAIRAIDLAEVLAKVPPAWQPIETAPKDGTMILVCLPRMQNLIVRARFNRIHGYWLNDYEGEGGITSYFSLHSGDVWMPLPTPPDRDG